MLLTRHQTKDGPRWALDGVFLPPSLTLSTLLELPRAAMIQLLTTLTNGEAAYGEILAPLDPQHEVWATGVNYHMTSKAKNPFYLSRSQAIGFRFGLGIAD